MSAGTQCVDFRVLGPLEVAVGGRVLELGGPQLRAVLALLVTSAGRAVSVTALVEGLWGMHAPSDAARTTRTYVSRLRKALRPADATMRAEDLIVTRPPGYALRRDPDTVDAARFERLAAAGRQALDAGQPAAAAERLTAALGLWRGEAYGEFAHIAALLAEGERLERLRLTAIQDRIDADLAAGMGGVLIAELEKLIAQHPGHERLWGQLMTALYRAGRQTDALRTFQRAREVLIEEFGLEPSPVLTEIQRQVLAQDSRLLPARTAEPHGGPAARPAQLPPAVRAFAGRATQLDQLDTLLAEAVTETTPAPVVITAIAGTAGVGKTALAVHWAHRVRERFPDGQLYVNLRGYAPGPPMRPIEALAQFLRALGVAGEQIRLELDEAAGMYRTMLADRRMLVVLDNASSPDQVRPLLPANPDCLVVITSRDRLSGLIARDGARRLTLDVLTADEAGALLARVLGHDRIQAESDAAAELARLCGYLPLALRIAAANLTNHPGRSITDHVAELRDTNNRLAALQVDDDEQTAVRVAFDLSYTTLKPDARLLFRLLGLVPGPDFTAPAAAVLTDTTPQQAQRVLDQLAGAHLIEQHAPNRFTFHDLLRLYAKEHAETEDSHHEREKALRRLFDFYLHTTDTASHLLYPDMPRLAVPPSKIHPPLTGFADNMGALAWLDTERFNLVAVAQHAAEHGPRQVAWLLADALRSYFWRSHVIDGLLVARAGLAAADAEGEPCAQAATHHSLGLAHYSLSRYPQAIEHYVAALERARQTGWQRIDATVLGNLGRVFEDLGRLDQAIAHCTQALTLCREIGFRGGEANALNSLGNVHWPLGQLDQAAAHYTQALALNREIGARNGEAVALNNLGGTYWLLGRLDDALNHLTQALIIERQIGNRFGEAATLNHLTHVHHDAGRFDQAFEFARDALALARDNGDRRTEANVLNTLGATHQRLGHSQEAIDHHQQGLRLACDTGYRHGETATLIGLATTHLDLNQHAAALDYARRAIITAHQAKYRVLEGQAFTVLANIHRTQEQLAEAIKHAQQALAIHRETGHRLGEARTLYVLGLALVSRVGSSSPDPAIQPGAPQGGVRPGGVESSAIGDAARRRLGAGDGDKNFRHETLGERQCVEAALAYWREALLLFTGIGTPEAAQVQANLQAHTAIR